MPVVLSLIITLHTGHTRFIIFSQDSGVLLDILGPRHLVKFILIVLSVFIIVYS